jgi:hypothetical protein
VVRAVYWGEDDKAATPLSIGGPARIALGLCALGMLWLGIFPANVLNLAKLAAASLRF